MKDVLLKLVDGFVEAAKNSTLTSGVLAVMFGGTVCYCAIAEKPVPEVVIWTIGVIVAYFFSEKLRNGRANRANRASGPESKS